jgi:drug/metabolite transporter (DMT)-like permease
VSLEFGYVCSSNRLTVNELPLFPILLMRSFPRQLIQSIDRLPGYILLWLAVPIFGSASAVTRKITEIGAEHFMGGHNPISYCNVLFVGNLCALLVLVPLNRHQLSRDALSQISGREWLGLFVVATLAAALGPGFIFQSLSLTSVTTVLLLGRLEPPLTLALSIWLLHERVNRWEVIGSLVAFVGVVLTVILHPDTAKMMPVAGLHIGLGESLATLAAVFLSIATIVSKKWLSQIPLGIYNTGRTGLGTIVFLCLALWMYGPHHFMGVLSPFLWEWMLLYGTVIVVVGQSLWNTGLRHSSIATVSAIGSFTPVVGILAAYLILGEVPTLAQYIGGSVILIGLVIGQAGIKMRTDLLESKRVNSLDRKQDAEARMGFKGI